MSDKHPIDEMFRGGLDGKGLNYDPKYWENMDSLIAGQKRRKYRKTLWLSLALLLLIAPATYFLVSDSDTITSENTPSQKKQEVRQPVLAENEESNDRQTEIVPETDLAQIDIDNSNKANKSQSTALKDAEQSVRQDMGTDPATRNNGKKTSSGIKTSSREIPAVEQDKEPATALERRPKRSVSVIQGNGFLLVEPGKWYPFSSISCRIKGSAFSPDVESSAPSPNPLHFTLLPYFEMGSVQHRYSPEIQNWKSNHESVQPYQRFGIDLRLNRGSFGLVLGMGMNRWTERTNYSREEIDYTLDSGLRLVKRQFIQRADGSYIAQLETVYDTVGTTRRNVIDCLDCPATFRYLTLPIGLYYQWGRGRLKLLTGAGIDFGFLTRTGGNYSINRIGDSWITGSDRSAFQKVLFHGRFNIGLNYQLNSFWSIQAQGFYRRSLNSMTTHYQQNPDQFGVSLGIGLRLK